MDAHLGSVEKLSDLIKMIIFFLIAQTKFFINNILTNLTTANRRLPLQFCSL